MIYIDCTEWAKPTLKERYPDCIFADEISICLKAKGIRQAIHDVSAPQKGDNWRVISVNPFHTIVEINESKAN